MGAGAGKFAKEPERYAKEPKRFSQLGLIVKTVAPKHQIAEATVPKVAGTARKVAATRQKAREAAQKARETVRTPEEYLDTFGEGYGLYWGCIEFILGQLYGCFGATVRRSEV